jgi:hypothetical protein
LDSSTVDVGAVLRYNTNIQTHTRKACNDYQ